MCACVSLPHACFFPHKQQPNSRRRGLAAAAQTTACRQSRQAELLLLQGPCGENWVVDTTTFRCAPISCDHQGSGLRDIGGLIGQASSRACCIRLVRCLAVLSRFSFVTASPLAVDIVLWKSGQSHFLRFLIGASSMVSLAGEFRVKEYQLEFNSAGPCWILQECYYISRHKNVRTVRYTYTTTYVLCKS